MRPLTPCCTAATARSGAGGHTAAAAGGAGALLPGESAASVKCQGLLRCRPLVPHAAALCRATKVPHFPSGGCTLSSVAAAPQQPLHAAARPAHRPPGSPCPFRMRRCPPAQARRSALRPPAVPQVISSTTPPPDHAPCRCPPVPARRPPASPQGSTASGWRCCWRCWARWVLHGWLQSASGTAKLRRWRWRCWARSAACLFAVVALRSTLLPACRWGRRGRPQAVCSPSFRFRQEPSQKGRSPGPPCRTTHPLSCPGPRPDALPQHTEMRPYSVDVYLNVTGGGRLGSYAPPHTAVLSRVAEQLRSVPRRTLHGKHDRQTCLLFRQLQAWR